MPIRQEPPAEPNTQQTAWRTPFPTDEAHRSRASVGLLPDSQPLAGPGEEPGTETALPNAEVPCLKSIVFSVAMALLGFVTAAALIHLALPHPLSLRADFRSGKVELASTWQGHAFSAAFGSSHVHNGFDPRSFDRTLAGTLLSTRTLNLAVAGGSQTEQRVMALDYLHHLQPPPSSEASACIVMLELNAGANFTNDHLIHPRAINIYDAGTYRFVRQLVSPSMPLQQRVGRLGFAASASLLHYMNLGMLSNRIFPPVTPDPVLAVETAEDRRGIWTLTTTPAFRANLQASLAQSPLAHTVTPGQLVPGNTALVDELATATPLRNVQFVYIVEPKLSDLADEVIFPPAIPAAGRLVPIINLAQPDLYPELYQLDNWFDNAHLNGQGAALASALLAQSLQGFNAAHPTPTRCGA